MPHPDLSAALDGLPLPQPERARILEEIAEDLEALRAELIRRGLDPVAASAEAVRLLAPGDSALTALASVHEPLYATLVRRFSSGVRAAEWLGLVGVTVVALGIALGALARVDLLDAPSPWLVLVLAAAAAVLMVAGRKAYQLYIVRDHHPARLHTGMTALLAGSGVAILLGFGSATVQALLLAARLEQTPARAVEWFLAWLLDASILVGTGLTTALLGGLAWILLTGKITAVEVAELRSAQAVRRATAPSTFDPTVPLTGGQP